VGVGSTDRLPVLDHRPAHRVALVVEVGHGRQVGGHLDRDPPGDRLPVEEPALHVADRDGARVVVGLLVLLLGAVVPGGAAGVGVADKRVGVQVLQGLSTHGCSFLGNDESPERTP
jgi:hypothetical protein